MFPIRCARYTQLLESLDAEGATVPAAESGYLQFVGSGNWSHRRACRSSDPAHSPSRSLRRGRPALAQVWPPKAAAQVGRLSPRAI